MLLPFWAGCLLMACGGGGAGAPSSPTPYALLEPVHIVDYGNSLAAGLMPGSIEGPPVPPAIAAQAELRLLLKREDVYVTSDGRGGTTASALLAGTDGSGLPWAQRLKASGAKLVAINHAINENAQPIEDYRAVLGELVREGQAAGVQVVLETPTPIVPGGTISVLFSIEAHELKAEVMRQVAHAMGAPLCDIEAAVRAAKLDNMASMPDGVHGTPEFYAFLGREEAKCMAPLAR